MALLAVSMVAFVATAHAQITPDFDARTQSETSGPFYIVFVARGGSLKGHAYVAWVAEDRRLRMSVQDARGLYCDDSNGDTCYFGARRGVFRNEAIQSAGLPETMRFTVQVNERTYERARNVQATWERQGTYQLLKNDCVSYVASVARALRLRVPRRTGNATPQEFVEALADANR